MKITRANHTTDVAHIIQPYIEGMLKRWDSLIMLPGMGFDQFKPFGELVIIDCQLPPKLDLICAKGEFKGMRMTQIYEKLALEVGLSVLARTDEKF